MTEKPKVLDKAMDHYHLRTENLVLKERLGDRFDFSRIIAASPKMKSLLRCWPWCALRCNGPDGEGAAGTGRRWSPTQSTSNSPRAGESRS